MKFVLSLLAVLSASAALAAGPKTNLLDHSNGNLISQADAKAVMAENIPARAWKIAPANRYAFVSQVEGGIKGSTCVVAARVMVLPLTPTVQAPLFRPRQTATAFDSQPNSSTEQCRTLAKEQLKAATAAVVTSLVR